MKAKRTRLKNSDRCKLGEKKVSGRPVTLVQMRVTAKVARLFFKELLRELCPPPVLE